MIRYGSAEKAMRPMAAADLKISHLKLLIIMAKAYLKGYPLGKFRKTAITQNAKYIFLSARKDTLSSKSAFEAPEQSLSQSGKPRDIFLLHRVQLLAVMLNASVEGRARGRFRNRAMSKNTDHICENLADRFQIGDAKFLKVA